MSEIPDSEKSRFFVYVIESPSAPDFYHGRSEGELLTQVLRLNMIPCDKRTAISKESLRACLILGLADAMKVHPTNLPILHLSMHGNEKGIQLSNGEVLTWDELRALLVPVNQSLENKLLLSMSACNGFSACEMTMDPDVSLPYSALVANTETPTWADTAVAYSAFYHRLANGSTLDDALAAMKAASGNNNWTTIEAAKVHGRFMERFNKAMDLMRAQRELQEKGEANNITAQMLQSPEATP